MLPILNSLNPLITISGFLVGVLDAVLAILLYQRRILNKVLLAVAIVTSCIVLVINIILILSQKG